MSYVSSASQFLSYSFPDNRVWGSDKGAEDRQIRVSRLVCSLSNQNFPNLNFLSHDFIAISDFFKMRSLARGTVTGVKDQV